MKYWSKYSNTVDEITLENPVFSPSDDLVDYCIRHHNNSAMTYIGLSSPLSTS
jgi:hypothetical protein